MKEIFRELYSVSFEAYVVYDAIDCDVAYGTLKIDALVMPALRLCIHRHIHDLAVKIHGDYVVKVKRAPYRLDIPPHRYVTYTDAPDILLLMKPGGGAAVLVCNASAEVCAKLRVHDVRDEEDAYTLIKRLIEIQQQHSV